MRFLCEIIVFYDDVDLPDVDLFFPSYWQAENFDSDGDFYYYGNETRWTNLEILKFYDGDEESKFGLNIYREKNRKYEPGIQEVADLARYVDYKNQGRYFYIDMIANISNLCVASLEIDTGRLEDYREFLEAVHTLLFHTKGVTANLDQCFDAETL
ncbi:hypothetical protein F2P44_27560 [Massilia sp. CCM 8695]|uniref:Uncharacterized protein n=1 Tax=Massilia frigida TaxID=2609281 RepID=A0ABX0NH86_9BURK|nr:hypothetical protein [Massilia frigida]NHZ83006.1 hypothetical protein [Massilia frigida]